MHWKGLLPTGSVTSVESSRGYLLQSILGGATFQHIANCYRGIAVGEVRIITSTGNGDAESIARHPSHRHRVVLPCGSITLENREQILNSLDDFKF